MINSLNIEATNILLQGKKTTEQQKEIFLRKVEFALVAYPEIYKNKELVNIINSIQSGMVKNETTRLNSTKNTPDTSLDVFIRKKMFEQSLKGEKISEENRLNAIKIERGLENISDDEFKSKIESGEVILEHKSTKRQNNTLLDTNYNKNIETQKIVIGYFLKIKNIINKDIKTYYSFQLENINEINSIIDDIYKLLKSINKDSHNLDLEFKILKEELFKGFNGKESIIKSSLFKIEKIINNL